MFNTHSLIPLKLGKEKVRRIFLLNRNAFNFYVYRHYACHLSIKTEQIIQYLTLWVLRIKQKPKSAGTDEASLLIMGWVNEESKR